ncbi:hypothetical protein LCGC14_0132120 [marine sediment metagenome]|uniref:Glycosyl transferase family 1 domain-containing protein n=1 Tax=marine sediment metagenome TaxID=412755 RepID=A0A0F9XKK9_9ZZZZ|nr:glycosyltransferase family 4 protein [Maribacter sp.]HDZ03948.1 glycosyltransferase family 4 protein [Maribacter sp.]HEC39448.1 glycosyltransferase family 4 protein [bacterium]
MKIDLVIGSLRSGGAERVVSTLANYFASQGHEVRLFTFKNGKDKYELDSKIKRIKFHRDISIFNYTLVRAFYYLLKFYCKKSNRPNVISAHIGLMGLPTIPIAKLYNIKIVISEHISHTNTPMNIQRKFLWNFLYRFADAITILTKYDLPFFKKKNKNVNIMYNPNSFSPLNVQTKKRLKQIISVGNLDRYNHKGFDNLLDIAYEIKKKYPFWKFQIIGEGTFGKKFLEDKINRLNLVDTVFLIGYKSDVDDILRNSSIYVLSSRYEGLPMGLIEAASQGVACIAYDCISGPSDIIENRVNGILIKNQDHELMTAGIIELIEDEKFRESLGWNATKSSDNFSLQKIGLQWEKLFISIQK